MAGFSLMMYYNSIGDTSNQEHLVRQLHPLLANPNVGPVALTYWRWAYSNYILRVGRPRDALPLLRDETRNDSLLLRLAEAERALPDARPSFDVHRADLAARFDAARARGDTLHQREEARFRLAIEGDVPGALTLARANWKVQREPADLRILAEAARAANDADAQKIVDDWIVTTRLSDATLGAVRGGRR